MLTMLLMYIKAFAVGGLFCLIGEILILKTKLTPARILVCYITAGVILSAIGLYGPIAQFAGAGATVPLTGFGHALAQGAIRAVQETGLLGAFTGGQPLRAASPRRFSLAFWPRCALNPSPKPNRKRPAKAVLSPDAFYADYSYLRLSITRLALPSLRASEPAGHSLTVACTRQEADNCAAT